MLVFFIEADGKIIHNVKDINQDEYEMLKDKADHVVTIIYDLGKDDT
jgi:hypothetical protein